MKKELIFVHDWIGPNGPLPNLRSPTLYDIASVLRFVTIEREHLDLGPRSMYSDFLEYVKDIRLVPTSEIESIGNKNFVYELQLDIKIFDHEFSDGVGVLDKIILDSRIYDRIKRKQGYLLLTTLFESFLEDEVFLAMHRYFQNKGIPLDRIIYFTNCINGDEIYQNFCKRNAITPLIKCEYIGLYVIQQVQEVIKNKTMFLKRSPKNKESLFLNFNRRTRSHRYTFLFKMLEYNLLDKIKMSFDRPNYFSKLMLEYHSLESKYKIKNLNREILQNLYNQLPFVLDTNNFNKFPMEDNLLDTAYLYETTHISLVSETNFENNIVHITEKTLKPIIFLHPFITIGPAYTLKYLKEMGFRTFDKFWDESYDNCLDPVERMIKVVSIIYEISNWPKEKLKKFEKDITSIVHHNFLNLFKVKEPTPLVNFIEKYGELK